jgi:predicted secreted protein
MQRRHLLQGAAGALPLAALGLAGLPRPVRAAWPERAFHDQDLAAVEADLFGDRTPQDSDAVVITAPEIAENGRVVPVEVSIDPDPALRRKSVPAAGAGALHARGRAEGVASGQAGRERQPDRAGGGR